MKNLLLFVLIIALPASIFAQRDSKLNTKSDSISYSLGVSMAKGLEMSGLQDIDPGIIASAIHDALVRKETKIAFEDAQEFLSSHLQELNTKMAAENLEKVNEFLRENEARQEVTTTASGLQYEVLEMGDGEKPAGDDTIITHYKGTLMDGTLFDSSYDRGYPATFKVNQVIEGWTEALQLMPVGSKWRLYIPPDLAYGENPPQGSNIKPNSLLIFDIELIEIKE